MDRIRLLHASLTFFILFTAFIANAQSTNVSFRVNMNHQIDLQKFNPETEFVDIAGSFNNWGGTPTVLNDSDADGIYTTSVSLNVGSGIEFKARINGEWAGREEFAGGGSNRSYTVQENGVVEFWYNDEVSPAALNVSIAASNVVIAPGQSVTFADQSSGDPVTWSWSFPGGTPASSNAASPVVSYSAEGTYDVSLTVTDADGETASKTFPGFVKVGPMETHWWNDVVFYEVFVRSFKDSNGDGKGDFKGLIEKLDYLNDGDSSTHTDLGINGIWLMPIQQSPSYHGYDVVDYRTIEQDYGTNEDFKRFMDEAHKRGIRVIIDFVMNHTSEQHDWFKDASSSADPKRNWYVWKPSNPGGTGPWGQTVWHSKAGSFYYGVFWSGMPDLNYNTQEVKSEMFDIATFWLEEMNVDGFRLDAVKYIFETNSSLEDTDQTFQFWKDFRTHYKSIDPDAFSVGEAWTATSTVKKYVNDNGLDYCFEFDLAGSMISAVNNNDVSGLKNKLREVMTSYPFLQFGTFLTNHDINRVMDHLGGDFGKAKAVADLLLTLPGIPYLYYGEEIGMTGSKPDENIRTPLQWTSGNQAGFTTGAPWRAVNNDFSTKNIEAQQKDESSLWNRYRNLIAIRNDQVALKRGNYREIDASNSSVLSFLRQHENENVLVVANPGSSTADNITLDVSLSGIAEGTYKLIEMQSGSSLDITVDGAGNFSVDIQNVPARSSLIYKVAQASEVNRTVTFAVDMREMMKKELFNASTETVDVIGTFNNFGDGTTTVLSDADNDSIYTVDISGIALGQTLQYKYRLNGVNDGREEFAGKDDFRRYLVLQTSNYVTDVYAASAGTVTASNEGSTKLFSAYPVPGKKFITVSTPPTNGKLKCTLSTTNGAVKMNRTFANTPSAHIHTLDTTSLQSGLYILSMELNNERSVIKILIEQ